MVKSVRSKTVSGATLLSLCLGHTHRGNTPGYTAEKVESSTGRSLVSSHPAYVVYDRI